MIRSTLLILTLVVTVSAQAKRLAVRTTPEGQSAVAVIFGTNGGYSIIAPFGRYAVDDAPFDLVSIRPTFEPRSLVRRFREETEITIQNNSSTAIKRVSLKIEVYDKQRRQVRDTLYVESGDTFKPHKRGLGRFYLSNFRASGDLFLLFMVTKIDFANGTIWENPAKNFISQDMLTAVESDNLH